MVNAVNYRIENGMTAEDAVLDGAMSRLRPVLMAATTTALGLIPMLLSWGVGAEIQRPLATVIVGGLVSSTLLTLVILSVSELRFYANHIGYNGFDLYVNPHDWTGENAARKSTVSWLTLSETVRRHVNGK